MLAIPGRARLFLCKHPVNMKKSFQGLSAIVEELFPGELLTGAFFIFLNRKRDLMKVFYFDDDGFVIWYKRLETGSFSWKRDDETRLDRRRFMMILEGVVPKRIQKRFSL